MTVEEQKVKRGPKSLIVPAIIVATIFLISLLFPQREQYDFTFQAGDTWQYENLIADKDYYVWKSEEELKAEKESLKIDFKPLFYRVNDKSAFYSRWKNLLQGNRDLLSAQDYTRLNTYLKSINNREVIKSDDLTLDKKLYNRLRLKSNSGIDEIRSEDYITVETLVEEMRPLTTIVADNDLYDIVTAELNTSTSKQELERSLEEVSLYKRKIFTGEEVILTGGIVDSKANDAIQAIMTAQEEDKYSTYILFAGYILLTCLIIGVYVLYLWLHYPETFESPRKIGFIMLLILLMSFLVYSIDGTQNLSTYMIPFCIVPIIMKSFFSDRLALFTHIVVVLIASFLSVLEYEFTFLQILAGIVAVLVIEDTRSWNKFFISIFSILGAYYVGHLGLILIEYQPQSYINWSIFRWLTISGVLTLLAYPFIPLIAKLFGFLNLITLSELADLNQPLLKELSINAPGTLQHSMQVANLAEAAGDAIGANTTLIKVGALYHDIGKLHNPMIFIENQSGINPHNQLNNFESARAIIAHSTEGVKMAQKAGLPKPIIDIIKSHHGDTRVEFFYRNQLNSNPDKEFDESLFRYTGPRPKTKEESILMIADSLEAASKSLKNPTGKDIDELVDKIVDYKIKHEQLSDSKLSFEDLQNSVEVFKTMLRNINHVRVEYPDEVKKPVTDGSAESNQNV
jgi:putative nucleotidyltransferase with HDIG domain